MKKFLALFSLVVCMIMCFCVNSYASDLNRSWKNPQYIKTYIPPNNKRTLMMKHACAEWSRKTKNKIIFRYVSSPNTAQLRVYFVDKIPNGDREIGLTKSRFFQGSQRMVSADVYIAEKTTTGRKLNNDAVYTVMLHEIGHAIGISAHSGNPMSIMYATEDDRQEILKSDLQTLAEIYGW